MSLIAVDGDCALLEKRPLHDIKKF
jgi:hypothetical protein